MRPRQLIKTGFEVDILLSRIHTQYDSLNTVDRYHFIHCRCKIRLLTKSAVLFAKLNLPIRQCAKVINSHLYAADIEQRTSMVKPNYGLVNISKPVPSLSIHLSYKSKFLSCKLFAVLVISVLLRILHECVLYTIVVLYFHFFYLLFMQN